MILGLSGEMQQGLVVLLMALCAVTITLTMLRRRQFQTVSARDLVREQFARLRDQKEIKVSMEELLLQLEDMSRRVNAQLDTKFVRLETVIRDADDRIARLTESRNPAALLASAPPPSNPTALREKGGGLEVKPQESPAPPTANPPDSPMSFSRCLPHVDPASSEVIRAESPERGHDHGDDTPGERESRDAPHEPLTEHHRRVYNLFDTGVAPIQIAQRLDVSLGEIELILNLRGFR